MDHEYQFKVDRRDYYAIRRVRQDEVIKSMHNLIKAKVKNVLEKANNDVHEHLINCVNSAESKYSANN